MCVGRGVENFRGFHPILEGSLWENTVRGANICPRPARERAQVSCTPCSSASVGPHLRRRCVCRTPDPTITLLWPGAIARRDDRMIIYRTGIHYRDLHVYISVLQVLQYNLGCIVSSQFAKWSDLAVSLNLVQRLGGEESPSHETGRARCNPVIIRQHSSIQR